MDHLTLLHCTFPIMDHSLNFSMSLSDSRDPPATTWTSPLIDRGELNVPFPYRSYHTRGTPGCSSSHFLFLKFNFSLFSFQFTTHQFCRLGRCQRINSLLWQLTRTIRNHINLYNDISLTRIGNKDRCRVVLYFLCQILHVVRLEFK